jgi:type II secretory pathway pseudopilin PulG
MKLIRPLRRNGFTIVELLISMTIAIILLVGALYSTAETYAVVRQGDARLNTQVHARRTLERLTKDCRYATSLAVTGTESTTWTISMTTGLSEKTWIWSWSADTDELTVSDGVDTETVVSKLTAFGIETETNDSGEISKITMNWRLDENPGKLAGKGAPPDPIAKLAASTWVRKSS